MEINKQELLTALEIVKPGLSNKDDIEQASSFAFMGGKLITYNDEISISYPVKNLKIEGAIGAELFYQILSKLRDEKIELTIDENEVKLKSGKAKIGLPLEVEINLPLEEIGKKGKWKELPKGFIDALKFVMFSASRDMSQPVLTCINVQKNGFVESSDNFRLSQFRLKDIPEDNVENFLIPSNTAKQLVNYDLTHIAEGNGWIHFKSAEKAVFSCRVFEDSFPYLSPHIERVKGIDFRFPSKLKESLDKASIFSKRDRFLSEAVTINIKEKKLMISAKGETGAWFRETIATKYSGESLQFKVNPSFLKEILSRDYKCEIADKMIKFYGDNWDHILMLYVTNE